MWALKCSCKSCRETVKKHALTFIFCLFYWAYELIMLIIWLSLGIGCGHAITYLTLVTTSITLNNAYQSYITIYILACGVFIQTTADLNFLQMSLIEVERRAPFAYSLYKTWPLRILLFIAYLELFIEFRHRYSFSAKEMEDEEETVTCRFLLAFSFLTYTLGRKVRQEFRLDEARAGVIFECPGVVKYCWMFAVFYTTELVAVFVWGFPLLCLAIAYRFYYFDEYICYFTLSALGIALGGFASLLERNFYCKGFFPEEPMAPLIHGEVKTNVLLFSVAPTVSRWYFRLQLEYEEYDTAKMVNFILFSTNVAFLLMHTTKQICYYQFKICYELGRILRREQGRRVHFADERNDDTVSTGTFTTTPSNSSSRDLYSKYLSDMSKRASENNDNDISSSDPHPEDESNEKNQNLNNDANNNRKLIDEDLETKSGVNSYENSMFPSEI